MRLIKNYAFSNAPLLSLKAIIAKTQRLHVFLYFPVKKRRKYRSVAFYQRVTLLRDGFPTVYH